MALSAPEKIGSRMAAGAGAEGEQNSNTRHTQTREASSRANYAIHHSIDDAWLKRILQAVSRVTACWSRWTLLLGINILIDEVRRAAKGP
jgi:hypothetical protein